MINTAPTVGNTYYHLHTALNKSTYIVQVTMLDVTEIPNNKYRCLIKGSYTLQDDTQSELYKTLIYTETDNTLFLTQQDAQNY